MNTEPMTRERFRQEAALAALGGYCANPMVGQDWSWDDVNKSAHNSATHLTAAMFPDTEEEPTDLERVQHDQLLAQLEACQKTVDAREKERDAAIRQRSIDGAELTKKDAVICRLVIDRAEFGRQLAEKDAEIERLSAAGQAEKQRADELEKRVGRLLAILRQDGPLVITKNWNDESPFVVIEKDGSIIQCGVTTDEAIATAEQAIIDQQKGEVK